MFRLLINTLPFKKQELYGTIKMESQKVDSGLKVKGYGFVSFKDPQDFVKAMREMNGKYVGTR